MLVGSSPGAAVHNTPDQARTQFSLWAVMVRIPREAWKCLAI